MWVGLTDRWGRRIGLVTAHADARPAPAAPTAEAGRWPSGAEVKISNAAFVLLLMSCLHGLITGTHILEEQTHIHYMGEDNMGNRARVFPSEQVIAIAMGIGFIILALSLVLLNRYLTVGLILLTAFALVDSLSRAKHSPGDVLGIGVILGSLVALLWFLPQLASLLIFLGLTWRHHNGMRRFFKIIVNEEGEQ